MNNYFLETMESHGYHEKEAQFKAYPGILYPTYRRFSPEGEIDGIEIIWWNGKQKWKESLSCVMKALKQTIQQNAVNKMHFINNLQLSN